MPPQIIELVQKPAATWPIWVPFSASVLLFLGSMLALYISNRTSRAAITAANTRERDRWRNDAVLKSVAAVMEISNDVSRELNGYLGWQPEDGLRERDDRLTHRVDDIAPHVAAFQLLVGDELAAVAEGHRKALHNAVFATLNFAEDRRKLAGDELRSARQRCPDSFDEVRNAQTTLIRAARVALGVAVIEPGAATTAAPR